MPANAHRRSHLHQHLARSTHVHPDLAEQRRRHPDWPLCGICGWVINPAAGPGPNHPNCEED